MKCIICKKYSLKLICQTCQDNFLQPKLLTRTLPDGFKIYSFYHYHDIQDLIKTKHTHVGASVYAILAENAFKKFSNEFIFINPVYALAIDDRVKSGYSHTAILTKALKSKHIKPVFASLRAQNHVTYSAKSLQFRLENPREFVYNFKRDIDAILVDDIVTTTSTINEAKNLLLKHEVNPMFALTIANAKEA
jgi:competence protein ComFC